MNHTSNFYIFGIDPGTNTGIAVYEIDNELNIVSIQTYTLFLNKYVNEDDNLVTKDGNRYNALNKLLKELLIKYNPKAVAHESSFINIKFKGSGMAVMGYIAIVTLTVNKFNKDILTCKLAPKSIKKFMGDAEADKDKIKELIPKELLEYLNLDVETEHSIDAIAIGYNLLTLLRKAPYLLK